MGCFPCFGSRKRAQLNRGEEKERRREELPMVAASPPKAKQSTGNEGLRILDNPYLKKEPLGNKEDTGFAVSAKTFTFRELATATKNFRAECFLGEGGFGKVYKGRLESTGQVVAVKQLDKNGLQGNREFLVEVLMLSLLHHHNLVNLIGYCSEGEQRLLVYEYMPLGSLEDHLLDLPPDKEPLDWNMRMKIAAGAAKGLEYLHDNAIPPVIYRDFKSSNILLDNNFHPKLSDFGLAKLGPVGDNSHVSTRVMGTYGYCAPEYAMTGHVTVKSDVYSFGVVLLELITGRRAIDNTRPHIEQNLVNWARPMFSDRRKLPKLADPMLQGRYPMRGLYQALAVASMCIQDEAASRPNIADVVTALSYLASQAFDPAAASAINHKPAIERRGTPPRNRDREAEHEVKEDLTKESRGSSKQNFDRERAVAEAKMWGENWRERARENADANANANAAGRNFDVARTTG